MTPAVPRYLSAASTDQGRVRDNNEDRVHADDARGIYAVVDGMGGHEAGERAAEIALERIRARLERQTGTAEQRIREAIALANNAVFESAAANPAWKGMACVLTVALIEDGRVTVGHVGDSRLYRVRRGSIEKVTHDHSPVGEREDRGELSEAEAMEHPRRNEVYRDVGSEEHTPDDEEFIELLQFPFEPDGALLLCSDGLSDALTSREILAIIERNAGDRFTTVRELLAESTQVGQDNISAILVEGERFAASFGKRAARPAVAAVADGRAAETTSRIAARSEPLVMKPHSPGWLWLAGGVVLGAAAMFAVQVFLLAKPAVPPPQTIAVAAGESITAALAKTRSGDTVQVERGDYRENVTLRDGVDLIAAAPHFVVIEGTITAGNVHHARVEGFVIRGAVRLVDSDVTLMRDTISKSQTAGVQLSGTSRGVVSGC